MLKHTLKKGIAHLPDLRNKDGSRVDGTSEPRPRKARCAVATGSSPVPSAAEISRLESSAAHYDSEAAKHLCEICAETAEHLRSLARDMRRELALTESRQPGSNKSI